MKLKNYLFINEITITAFAKTVGVHKTYMSQISSGKIVPSMKIARKIEDATDGNVTMLEILKLCEYKPIEMKKRLSA
jgi:DNA-binding XRE family transcriptional regulator